MESGLHAGHVLLREGDTCSVTLDGCEVIARRAASCLLRPEPGDRVLLTLAPEPFVLAVLERHGERRAHLSVDGDAVLATSGALELSAEDGVAVRSPQSVSLVSPRLDVRAREGSLVFERLTTVAKAALANFDTAGLVARACDVVAERISERAARVFRTVTEYEQLRARHIDHRADESVRLHADTTMVTARGTAKIDGAQVHIG
jgi:hypothetical protein